MQHYYTAGIRPLYQCEHPPHLNVSSLFARGFIFLNNQRKRWVHDFPITIGGKSWRGFKKTENNVAKKWQLGKNYEEGYSYIGGLPIDG